MNRAYEGMCPVCKQWIELMNDSFYGVLLEHKNINRSGFKCTGAGSNSTKVRERPLKK